MAKLTGPLMSFSASGTVGRAATFRQDNGRNVGQLKRQRPDNPTARQSAARAIWQRACQQWYAESNDTRAKWYSHAATLNLPALALYCREYTLQQTDHGASPMIPAVIW